MGVLMRRGPESMHTNFNRSPNVLLPAFEIALLVVCCKTFRAIMTQVETMPVASAPRADGRWPNQLRRVRFQNHIAPHATGSTLIEWGNTRVICGVTVEDSVPRW